MMERTLIVAKPDAVQRRLIGEIFSRFEKKGFKLVASKFTTISLEASQKHYAMHKTKPFYDAVCEYLSSSPSFLMVWEGVNIIALSRNMIGATDPAIAQCGSIRGDFGLTKGYNLVHGSDSRQAADYEISLHFTKSELVDYILNTEKWLLGND